MDIRIFESRSFASVTGVELDADELWRAGERIWNLRRAVMVKREGRSRSQDTYADRFFDTPWPDIQDGGRVYTAYVDRSRFEALKDRYYDLAGWDARSGRPTREKLRELDLGEIADELSRQGLLP
jgi:aldehyde:ferredoxin oxidoreductase